MNPFRIVYMGTGTFAEPALLALLASSESVVGVFTQPEREGVNKRGTTRQTGLGIGTIATQAQIPVFRPENINLPENIAILQSLQPDLFVVAAYGQILSKEVLAIPRIAAINIHASLLPKYRGAAPVAWAILNGETETGVTIIRMSAGLDAGEMLAQEKIAILPHETAGELESRLAQLGVKLTLEVIQKFHEGTVRGIPQDPSQVTKAPKLKKEMGQIDWSRSALSIARSIRGLQPWPTAYTHRLRTGRPPVRIVLTKSEPTEIPVAGTPAGTLKSESSPKRLLVACGDFFLEILELQPAGGKRMPASSYLLGYPIQPEDRFGNV
jgi:methionyl-tRNA formyltransferase